MSKVVNVRSYRGSIKGTPSAGVREEKEPVPKFVSSDSWHMQEVSTSDQLPLGVVCVCVCYHHHHRSHQQQPITDLQQVITLNFKTTSTACWYCEQAAVSRTTKSWKEVTLQNDGKAFPSRFDGLGDNVSQQPFFSASAVLCLRNIALSIHSLAPYYYAEFDRAIVRVKDLLVERSNQSRHTKIEKCSDAHNFVTTEGNKLVQTNVNNFVVASP